MHSALPFLHRFGNVSSLHSPVLLYTLYNSIYVYWVSHNDFWFVILSRVYFFRALFDWILFCFSVDLFSLFCPATTFFSILFCVQIVVQTLYSVFNFHPPFHHHPRWIASRCQNEQKQNKQKTNKKKRTEWRRVLSAIDLLWLQSLWKTKVLLISHFKKISDMMKQQ